MYVAILNKASNRPSKNSFKISSHPSPRTPFLWLLCGIIFFLICDGPFPIFCHHFRLLPTCVFLENAWMTLVWANPPGPSCQGTPFVPKPWRGQIARPKNDVPKRLAPGGATRRVPCQAQPAWRKLVRRAKRHLSLLEGEDTHCNRKISNGDKEVHTTT